MKDNTKMHLKGMEYDGVGWIHLSQNRDKWRAVVNTALNLWVPQKARNLTDEQLSVFKKDSAPWS
jgi:hypothetical protein